MIKTDTVPTEVTVTAVVEAPVYENLTVDQLMELLDERDLAYARRSTKPKLIEVLRLADAAELESAVEDAELTHRSVAATVGAAVITPFALVGSGARSAYRHLADRIEVASTIRQGRKSMIRHTRQMMYQQGKLEKERNAKAS